MNDTDQGASRKTLSFPAVRVESWRQAAETTYSIGCSRQDKTHRNGSLLSEIYAHLSPEPSWPSPGFRSGLDQVAVHLCALSRWDPHEANTAKHRHESDNGERMLGGFHKESSLSLSSGNGGVRTNLFFAGLLHYSGPWRS